jgi:hypothetical protein
VAGPMGNALTLSGPPNDRSANPCGAQFPALRDLPGHRDHSGGPQGSNYLGISHAPPLVAGIRKPPNVVPATRAHDPHRVCWLEGGAALSEGRPDFVVHNTFEPATELLGAH